MFDQGVALHVRNSSNYTFFVFFLKIRFSIRLKFNERNISVRNLQNVEYFIDNMWN
jgi:hypothetical protein